VQSTDSEQRNRLGTVIAVLIALTTLIGALVAWRASVASDGAGDADFAGQRATVNLEETRALSAINSYEHYSAFTTYRRYSDLGDLIAEDDTAVSDEQADLLARTQAEAYDLAIANQGLFPNKFLNRDGSYALQRQIGEWYADTAKEKDLQPDIHYAEADKLDNKAGQLLLAVTTLAIGLVFYSLVEVAGRHLRYALLGIGSLCLLAGTLFALMVEIQA
jgi:hypothetical protein